MPNSSDTTPATTDVRAKHLRITTPSPWLQRFQHLIAQQGRVLDLAAGGGRHGRSVLDRASGVVFIDRDIQALHDLLDHPKARVIEADLEGGTSPFEAGGALADERFDAVIVVNYLYRSLLDGIIDALNPSGVLIYETFARGNEAFARPRNPDHLLKSGELLAAVADKMQVIAYEHGRVEASDIPGVKQRLCAVKDLQNSERDDGDPPAHPLAPTTK
jgi:SAM-dependent methyltransferase